MIVAYFFLYTKLITQNTKFKQFTQNNLEPISFPFLGNYW